MNPEITMRSASDLIPYARNARTHSEQQIAMIAGSIRDFGFRNPVLVDGDNGIIAGHARVAAALKLDLPKIPCIDCSDMSDTQRRAYILADNRLALNAGWDQELLALELTDLSELDVDLEALGFDETEIDLLLASGPADQTNGTGGAGSLSDRFGIPPFSVLNAREGWWQDRKRAWIALGIQSELGRGENIDDDGHVSSDERTASFKNQGALRALQKKKRKVNGKA